MVYANGLYIIDFYVDSEQDKMNDDRMKICGMFYLCAFNHIIHF